MRGSHFPEFGLTYALAKTLVLDLFESEAVNYARVHGWRPSKLYSCGKAAVLGTVMRTYTLVVKVPSHELQLSVGDAVKKALS
jgi:hypothetical protein